ncbi:hypothetical protein BB559_002806 [Furculomyces boomerangus]|uniref:Protein kinase domain-containing protein n=1 Tax=Furculomyces boomerangus TaxID=61424 RepID=A0A2T9YSG7_9FUNG|nr:hypothetical protein BB559_002806 [Furculomyces boomerangus]
MISGGHECDQEDITNMDVFEHQKENIQPLKRGRSAKMLAKLYGDNQNTGKKESDTNTKINSSAKANWVQSEENKFLKEIESLNLEENDDPIDIYFRYARWSIEVNTASQGNNHLIQLLEKPLRLFRDQERYRNDTRYLKLWLWYIELIQQSQEDVFQYLLSNKIGDALALFYEEYAGHLESKQKISKADEIYQLGINRKAQPLERIQKKYTNFQQRVVAFTKYQIKHGSEALDTNTSTKKDTQNTITNNNRKMLGVKMSSADAQSVQANVINKGSFSQPFRNNANSKIKVYSDPDNNTQNSQHVQIDQKWEDIGTDSTRRKENIREASQWKGQKIHQNSFLNAPANTTSGTGFGNNKPKKFQVHVDVDDDVSSKEHSSNLSNSKSNIEQKDAIKALGNKKIKDVSGTTELLEKNNTKNQKDEEISKEIINNPTKSVKEITYIDLKTLYSPEIDTSNINSSVGSINMPPEYSIEMVRAMQQKYRIKITTTHESSKNSSNNYSSKSLTQKNLTTSSPLESPNNKIEVATAFDNDTTISLKIRKGLPSDSRNIQSSNNQGTIKRESFNQSSNNTHKDRVSDYNQNYENINSDFSAPTIHTIDAQRQMLEIWQGAENSSDDEVASDSDKEHSVLKPSLKNMIPNDDYQFTMGPVIPLGSLKDMSFGLTPNIQKKSKFETFADSNENNENSNPQNLPNSSVKTPTNKLFGTVRKVLETKTGKLEPIKENNFKNLETIDQGRNYINENNNSPKNEIGKKGGRKNDYINDFESTRMTTGRIPTITGAHTLDSLTASSSMGYVEAFVDTNIMYTNTNMDTGAPKSSFADFTNLSSRSSLVKITPIYNELEEHGINNEHQNKSENKGISLENSPNKSLKKQNRDNDSFNSAIYSDSDSETGLESVGNSGYQNHNPTGLQNELGSEKLEHLGKQPESQKFTVFRDETSIIHIDEPKDTRSITQTEMKNNVNSEFHNDSVRDYHDSDMVKSVIEPFWPLARNVYLTLLDKISVPVESFQGYHDCIDLGSKAMNIAEIYSKLSVKGSEKKNKTSDEIYLQVGLDNGEGYLDFLVHQISGVGGFAQIYLVSAGNENSRYNILKTELPANVWEFYITRTLQMRLIGTGKNKRGYETASLFLNPISVFEYTDVTLTQFDYLQYGTLLDAVNLWNGSEPLTLLIVTQVIRSVLAMHSVEIVHTDIKPENLMLDFDSYLSAFEKNLGSEDKVLKNCVYSATETGSFVSLIKLIDMGRSVDWSVLHKDQLLRVKPASLVDTDKDTISSKDGYDPIITGDVPVWSPHADWIGVARVTYLLLFGSRLVTDRPRKSNKFSGCTDIIIKESTPFRRYWNNKLWKKLFELCLSGIPSPKTYKNQEESSLGNNDGEFMVLEVGEVWRDCVHERIEPNIIKLLEEMEGVLKELIETRKHDLEKGVPILLRKLFVLSSSSV